MLNNSIGLPGTLIDLQDDLFESIILWMHKKTFLVLSPPPRRLITAHLSEHSDHFVAHRAILCASCIKTQKDMSVIQSCWLRQGDIDCNKYIQKCGLYFEGAQFSKAITMVTHHRHSVLVGNELPKIAMLQDYPIIKKISLHDAWRHSGLWSWSARCLHQSKVSIDLEVALDARKLQVWSKYLSKNFLLVLLLQ